ncbi:MAG: hypothetical protein NZ703_00530 [Gemmataceae bacterium]|nr:hypothetical protein [Gemmataceae bacterium]
MQVREIRQMEEATRYLLEGLWWSRVAQPLEEPAVLTTALEWAQLLVAEGMPLPPLSFVVDVGLLASGRWWQGGRPVGSDISAPTAALLRAYDDRLLTRLSLDPAFEQAAAALARYHTSERPRALAFLLKQLARHLHLGGATLSLEVLRSLLQRSQQMPLHQFGPTPPPTDMSPFLQQLYTDMLQTVRRLPLLVPWEDVAALEDRSALGGLAQQVALRQIRRMISWLQQRLPPHPPKVKRDHLALPTRLPIEDHYPVGGYASITTRGSLESLLHSQLAYMEDETPDLFDVKFLRNELLYYSRDENQFTRQRRIGVFLLGPDLRPLRFKDPKLPCQRMILLLAAIIVIIHRLLDWLSHETVRFEIRWLESIHAEGSHHGSKAASSDWEEQPWLELLLRPLRQRGNVVIDTWSSPTQAYETLQRWSHQARVFCLRIDTSYDEIPCPATVHATRWLIDGPFPRWLTSAPPDDEAQDEPMLPWPQAVTQLLEHWLQ